MEEREKTRWLADVEYAMRGAESRASQGSGRAKEADGPRRRVALGTTRNVPPGKCRDGEWKTRKFAQDLGARVGVWML